MLGVWRCFKSCFCHNYLPVCPTLSHLLPAAEVTSALPQRAIGYGLGKEISQFHCFLRGVLKNGASRAEKTSSDLTAPPSSRPCPPAPPAARSPRCPPLPHRPHRRRQPRAVQERSDPGLHPRWRGHVLFPLFVRERGACLHPQEQEAARGCRLRRRPERVTAVERRQAAKTACSLPTHRPAA